MQNGHLEAVDVRKGRLRIYDREGRPVRALIRKKLLAEVVELEDTSDPPRADELRHVLLRFLDAAEHSPKATLEALPLSELVDRAVQHKTP